MFLSVTTFEMVPEDRKTVEACGDALNRAFNELPGNHNIQFFLNEELGKCGSITIAESPEALDAITKVLRPITLQYLGEEGVSTVVSNTFEIYKPKE